MSSLPNSLETGPHRLRPPHRPAHAPMPSPETISSPLNDPLATPVVSSSIFSPFSARTLEISRTIPGRSLPTTSNSNRGCVAPTAHFGCRAGRQSASPGFPTSAGHRATPRAPLHDDAGELAASLAIRLSNQLPLRTATASDRARTRPGRSGPTTVRIREAMIWALTVRFMICARTTGQAPAQTAAIWSAGHTADIAAPARSSQGRGVRT